MIDLLQSMSSDDALSVLSGAVARLLPDPGIKPRTVETPESEALLRRTRELLGIAPDDESPAARQAILKLLGDEMSQQALRGKDIDAIRARLGDRGALPPEQYRIEFQPDFSTFAEKRGIGQQQVVDAIHQADAVEHLAPIRPDDAESARLSLFARHLPDNQSTLLVHGQRHRNILTVHKAWKFYRTDVPLTEVDSLLAMLRAFVSVYGIEFSVEGLQEQGKFVTQRLVRSDSGFPGPVFENEENHKLEGCFVVRKTAQGEFEVGVAYVIDLVHYVTDLARHGDDVSV